MLIDFFKFLSMDDDNSVHFEKDSEIYPAPSFFELFYPDLNTEQSPKQQPESGLNDYVFTTGELIKGMDSLSPETSGERESALHPMSGNGDRGIEPFFIGALQTGQASLSSLNQNGDTTTPGVPEGPGAPAPGEPGPSEPDPEGPEGPNEAMHSTSTHFAGNGM